MGLFQFLAKFFMGLTIGELFVVNLESGIVFFQKSFEFTFQKTLHYCLQYKWKFQVLQIKMEYPEYNVKIS